MGIASLVLGVLAILLTMFTAGIMGWLSILLGITGIILGIFGKKDAEDKYAQAGLITSIVGTSISVLIYIACIGCIGLMSMAA